MAAMEAKRYFDEQESLILWKLWEAVEAYKESLDSRSTT